MKPLVLAALALGICAAPAQAQDAHRPRPRMEDMQQRIQDRVAVALNLTDAQKGSFAEIRAKHKAALDSRRAAAQAAHKAFAEAMKSPDAKPEDLRNLHRAQADAAFELLLEHRAQRIEFRAILTPEQREKAAKLEGRMEGRMEGMRRMHRGGMAGM
jgi:Spy/CpxP family protein refolding chaperone